MDKVLRDWLDTRRLERKAQDVKFERELQDRYQVSSLLEDLRRNGSDLEVRLGSERQDTWRQKENLQARLRELEEMMQKTVSDIANLDLESSQRQRAIQQTADTEKTRIVTALEHAKTQFESEKAQRYEEVLQKRKEEDERLVTDFALMMNNLLTKSASKEDDQGTKSQPPASKGDALLTNARPDEPLNSIEGGPSDTFNMESNQNREILEPDSILGQIIPGSTGNHVVSPASSPRISGQHIDEAEYEKESSLNVEDCESLQDNTLRESSTESIESVLSSIDPAIFTNKEKIIFKVSRSGIFTSPAIMKGVPLTRLRESTKPDAYWDPGWQTIETFIRHERECLENSERSVKRLLTRVRRGEDVPDDLLDQQRKSTKAIAGRVRQSEKLAEWVTRFDVHPNQILGKDYVPKRGLLRRCYMVPWKSLISKLSEAKKAGKIHARPSTWIRRRLIRKIMDNKGHNESISLGQLLFKFSQDRKYQNVLSALRNSTEVDDSDDTISDYESGLDDDYDDYDSSVDDEEEDESAGSNNSLGVQSSAKRTMTEAELSPSTRHSKHHCRLRGKDTIDVSVLPINSSKSPERRVPIVDMVETTTNVAKIPVQTGTNPKNGLLIDLEDNSSVSAKIPETCEVSDNVRTALQTSVISKARKVPMRSARMGKGSYTSPYSSVKATARPTAVPPPRGEPRHRSEPSSVSFTLVFFKCGREKPWEDGAISLRLNATQRCFEPYDKNDSPLKFFHEGNLVVAADWVRELKYITKIIQGDSVCLEKIPMIGRPRGPGVIYNICFRSATETDHFVSLLTSFNEKIIMSSDDEARLNLYNSQLAKPLSNAEG